MWLLSGIFIDRRFYKGHYLGTTGTHADFLLYSHLFAHLVKFMPLALFTPGTATITLRNELGSSVPITLDKSTRGDIFKFIRRDQHEKRDDGHAKTQESSEMAWIR